MSRTPAAEVEIDAATVAALVAAQFPQLGGLDVRWLGHGWDNWMFRLGEDYVVRLPRRAAAVELLENEARLIPLMAPRLPIPVPGALHVGVAGEGYPWPWLIARWFPGDNPDRAPLACGQAPRLAAFLAALHSPANGAAPANAHRDIPLSGRSAHIAETWQVLARHGEPIAPPLAALWDRACAAPYPGEPRWLHGDLHYANVLVEAGKFTAIVDWGDICAGDPATDLAALWLLIGDPAARAAGLAAYGADDYGPDGACRLRAMGWALSFASVLRASGLTDNPRHAAMGRAAMARLLDDLAR